MNGIILTMKQKVNKKSPRYGRNRRRVSFMVNYFELRKTFITE